MWHSSYRSHAIYPWRYCMQSTACQWPVPSLHAHSGQSHEPCGLHDDLTPAYQRTASDPSCTSRAGQGPVTGPHQRGRLCTRETVCWNRTASGQQGADCTIHQKQACTAWQEVIALRLSGGFELYQEICCLIILSLCYGNMHCEYLNINLIKMWCILWGIACTIHIGLCRLKTF